MNRIGAFLFVGALSYSTAALAADPPPNAPAPAPAAKPAAPPAPVTITVQSACEPSGRRCAAWFAAGGGKGGFLGAAGDCWPDATCKPKKGASKK